MRFSQACENNKNVILEQLQIHFADRMAVLEIGSGTGQHAVHFASNLPHLTWHTSDLPENHASISAWMAEWPSDNLRQPISFKVGLHTWPELALDAVFSANTAHIMQKLEVMLLMQMVAVNLPASGVFCQYGPFKVDGEFTSESNRAFDAQLRAQGYGGYRDIEELEQWAGDGGLVLTQQLDMPANNMLLVWQKA